MKHVTGILRIAIFSLSFLSTISTNAQTGMNMKLNIDAQQVSHQIIVLDVVVENLDLKKPFYRFQLTEELVNAPDFQLNTLETYKNSSKLNSIMLLPLSITVLTTNGLKSSDSGIIE